MIEKVADFIIKRHKLIIIVWLPALVIALPFVSALSSALVYDETSMTPDDAESTVAQNYIDEYFGSESSTADVIIVLQSDSILAQEALEVIYNIQLGIYQQSSTAEVVSVYTVPEAMVAEINTLYWSLGGDVSLVMAYLEAYGLLPSDLENPDTVSSVIDLVCQELTADPTKEKLLEFTYELVGLLGFSTVRDLFPAMESVISSLVSENGQVAMMTATYSDDGITDDQLSELRTIVSDAADETSVEHWITGSAPLSSDMEESTMNDLSMIEPVTIILILVLIGLFFRSIVGAAMPPISVGIALGISFSLVYLLSFVMQIHYSVETLMLTGMMGAGCDYCIFILSRYREERKSGRDKEHSVREAVTWAGESITTSGATVIIGFGALAIADFTMLRSMGIALAIGILIALLVALTLIPSLLMLLGDKLFWPSKFTKQNAEKPKKEKKKTREGYFTRSAKFSIKHAKVLVVAMILISIPAVYLVVEMDQSYDFISAMGDSESTEGLEVLGENFGSGVIMPTQVAVEFDEAIIDEDGNITETYEQAVQYVQNIASLEAVASVTDITATSDLSSILANGNKTLLLTVIFQDDPYSEGAMDAINTLRGTELTEDLSAITAVYVAGSTAQMYDISVLVQDDMTTVEIVVVIAIYLILLFVLGAVISPLRSIVTILLSISWTLAAMVLVFQYWLGEGILWVVPLVLLVVCLGLGMDYDILLTTRIREEIAKGKSNNEAIIHSVEKTGGIITACGFIMAAAFGSMMLSSGYLLKEFGFALMVAILLDAMFVRIYLVPAIMSLLGKWNWWAPSWLAKRYEKRNARKVKNAESAREQLSSQENSEQ